MSILMNSPLLVFALSLLALSFAVRIAIFYRRRQGNLDQDEHEDFDVILAATFTLLGLLIGFSFAMAVSHYDQRKHYEEAEANAMGTEFVRADLLPAADAARVRDLLRSYLDQRVLFYETRDERRLPPINAATAQLQANLWYAVQAPAAAQPTSMTALVVSGMNDVLNSQGYTQAAWWNRIPTAAWGLMAAVAIGCHLLLGYGARRASARMVMVLVLPLVVSISFFLIADIDTPRGGVIRVRPQNLISLAESWHAH